MPIIPSILHATVVKKTKSAHLGLSLMVQNGDLIVSNISPDSPFQDTSLRVGFEILSINRHHFSDSDKAVDYLKHVEGSVDIMVSNHPFPKGGEVTFVKNHPLELINSLEFSRLNETLVRIDSINSFGPFAKGMIEVGDVVLSINNKVVADPVVASRLLISCDEHSVFLLTLSRRKFLEAAIESMVLKQNKSIPWTKPIWIPPNKISIGRQDWNVRTVLRFETGGVCELDEPHLFLEPDMNSESAFKMKYSDWYTYEVKPRIEEINDYLSSNIANVAAATRRTSYLAISPDEAVVSHLANLASQHKSKKLSGKEYAAAKNKLLGLRITSHTESEC